MVPNIADEKWRLDAVNSIVVQWLQYRFGAQVLDSVSTRLSLTHTVKSFVQNFSITLSLPTETSDTVQITFKGFAVDRQTVCSFESGSCPLGITSLLDIWQGTYLNLLKKMSLQPWLMECAAVGDAVMSKAFGFVDNPLVGRWLIPDIHAGLSEKPMLDINAHLQYNSKKEAVDVVVYVYPSKNPSHGHFFMSTCFTLEALRRDFEKMLKDAEDWSF